MVNKVCDFEVVKDVILKAFKLVPEAYRLNFRILKREDNKIYLEFARAKEQSFIEWCMSVEVKTLDDLLQLVLLEDFKKNLPWDIRLYVEENHVNTLHRAGELVAEYHLIHYFNNSFQKSKSDFENSKGSMNSFHSSSEASQTKEQKINRK